MFKIKKKSDKQKPTVLYNIIEDYSEFDAPGNVTVCAMTLPEDLAGHAKILSESYDVPFDTMTKFLTEGGVHVYPQVGGLLTRGVFACIVDQTGSAPKQTFVLDLMQFAEAEQIAQARSIQLGDAALSRHYDRPGQDAGGTGRHARREGGSPRLSNREWSSGSCAIYCEELCEGQRVDGI